MPDPCVPCGIACFVCGAPTFRGIPHPTVPDRFEPLWPHPLARFAMVLIATESWTEGIQYCPACPVALYDEAPVRLREQHPSASWVAAVETAVERYTKPFDSSYEGFLLSWLPREAKLDPAPFVAQWRQDRAAGLRPDEARMGPDVV